jgi:cyclomaltodextrinase
MGRLTEDEDAIQVIGRDSSEVTIITPHWVKHAVFYQIFPDRFARSSRTQHAVSMAFRPWGSPPKHHTFQGGDLRGIVDRLDYLGDLGVNALYLTPIFCAASDHRYNTYDYYQVDPLLGGNEALRELLDEAHTRGIRIILDGVFNHVGRGFWPFHHVVENGEHSPYRDWFIIHDWPLHPYASDADHPANYAHWSTAPGLPRLNTRNPDVRTYIMDVVRHWLEFGIDGWRLDAVQEIDDHSFWQALRQVAKSTNPEAYLVGEIFEPAQVWLQGDQFDASMNYSFAFPTLCFFGARSVDSRFTASYWTFEALDAPTFARHIDRMHGQYDWEVNHAQLNLLGSHDGARALTIMGGDKSALRLCALFQMTMPGAPCIYYGDEVGLTGDLPPHCRGAFPWHAEETWDHELLEHYRRAIALRHRYPVLRTGTFKAIHAAGDVYGFRRVLDRQEAVVVFNAGTSDTSFHVNLSDLTAATFLQAWPRDGGRTYVNHGGRIEVTLPARDALVLIGGSR